MRGGKFLAEESPESLLAKYQCDSLEGVFLKLAVLQNLGKRRRSSIAQEIVEQVASSQAIDVSLIFGSCLKNGIKSINFIIYFCLFKSESSA